MYKFPYSITTEVYGIRFPTDTKDEKSSFSEQIARVQRHNKLHILQNENIFEPLLGYKPIAPSGHHLN